LADALGADRKALVAQARSIYRGQIALDRISAPTLVLAGDDDPLAVRPRVLADALPDATLRTIPGNHIAAVADPSFTRLLVDFLA
jgi:pimeloyl-ACP methyl ester carboxylesterase